MDQGLPQGACSVTVSPGQPRQPQQVHSGLHGQLTLEVRAAKSPQLSLRKPECDAGEWEGQGEGQGNSERIVRSRY